MRAQERSSQQELWLPQSSALLLFGGNITKQPVLENRITEWRICSSRESVWVKSWSYRSTSLGIFWLFIVGECFFFDQVELFFFSSPSCTLTSRPLPCGHPGLCGGHVLSFTQTDDGNWLFQELLVPTCWTESLLGIGRTPRTFCWDPFKGFRVLWSISSGSASVCRWSECSCEGWPDTGLRVNRLYFTACRENAFPFEYAAEKTRARGGWGGKGAAMAKFSVGNSLMGNSFLWEILPPLHAVLLLVAKMKPRVQEEVSRAVCAQRGMWLGAAALLDFEHMVIVSENKLSFSSVCFTYFKIHTFLCFLSYKQNKSS